MATNQLAQLNRMWNSNGISTATKMTHKDYVNSVMECEPILSRITKIRMNSTPRNLSIIQIYAPTSDSSEDEIDCFYSQLESTTKTSKRKTSLLFKEIGIQRLT
ncbi:Uncharacterised protein r2_g3220 [Pycnogonum litorale]